jgi:hypothetical protein
MFMSIFKGRARGIGEAPTESVYMKVGVELRKHLHHFKGARLAVFMAIALHADENGESFPSYETLEKETGYGSDTISNALKGLCGLVIDGHRVLAKHRERDEEGRYSGGNKYLIFPTQGECQMWENPDMAKTRGGKSRAEEEPASKVEPSFKEEKETTLHAAKSNADFTRAPRETQAPQAQQSSLLPASPNENGSHQRTTKPRAKKESNPQTIPILDAYLSALGYEHIVSGEDRKAAKTLADAGYLPEQVTAAYKHLSQEDWWKEQDHISLMSLVKRIGGILKKLGYSPSRDGSSVQTHQPTKPNYLTFENTYT